MKQNSMRRRLMVLLGCVLMLTACADESLIEPIPDLTSDTSVSDALDSQAALPESESTVGQTTSQDTAQQTGDASDSAATSTQADGSTQQISDSQMVQSNAATEKSTSAAGGTSQTTKHNSTSASAVTTAMTFLTTAVTTTTTAKVSTTSEPAAPAGTDAAFRQKIAGMTLEEKVMQMLLVSGTTANAKAAASAGAGGLCLFADSFNGKTKAQVIQMTADMQSRNKIPMLISVDEEGGTVVRVSLNTNLRKYRFWSPSKLFAEGGWDLIESDTKEKADLLLSLGINCNLAPVCDVPLSANDYIYNRCFSMNANETAEYIRRVVTVMGQNGLGSTLKHFPGYGGSADTHKGMGYDNRDISAFEQSDLLPFEAGIAAGANSVMVSHNIVNCMDSENPASLSKNVHDLLRSQLGFQGVIITDDLGMDAIKIFCGSTSPAVKAVMAGNDLLCGADYLNYRSAIVAAVQNGSIPESQIDDSVLRIFRWKHALGLM